MPPDSRRQRWLQSVCGSSRWFLAVAVLLLGWAGNVLASPEPVNANAVTELVLGRHLMVLVDDTNLLNIDDIRRPEYERRFEPVFVDTPYYGRTHSTYWFRLQLAFDQPGDPRLIEIAYPHLRQITLYQQTNGGPLKVTESGYSVALDDRSHCLRFCFMVKGEAGIHTLYFRVKTDSPLFLPITLRSPEEQLLSERISMGSATFFYGAFIVMALFNLFVYFSTQERSYLIYVIYITSLVIWTSSHDGLLRELVLQQYGNLASYTTHFLLTLLPVIFGALFCQTFLKTRETMPLHHRLFSFLIALCLVDVLMVLITGRMVLPNSVNLLSVTFSVAGLSASILGWMRGLKTARFFLTAWVAVILGMLMWVLTISGVLPFNPLTAFGVHVGALLETILLSLALGDRINVLQAERIQVEQDAIRKLEESNQKLEASNRFKDEFLSTVSHELRTPMNGIVGATELLEHTPLNSEQFKYLSTINRSSRDMLAMVENILTYTQFEAGTAAISNQAIKLRKLLDEIAAHYRGRAAVQQLDFRYFIDPSIPDDLVGDQDKLKLLLEHLLDNAAKFTDHGQIRFDVTIDDEHSHAREIWLRFVIKDTGCGVPESLQKEIFDSFKQADGSMTRRKGGLGIGLALCKRIVDILQGQMIFKSAAQQGTTVVVTLPFQPCMTSIELVPDQIVPTIDPATVDVLVVEDNYVNKLVLEGFLKKLGFNVFTAENGKEAIAMLEKRLFNLILMDCQMPVMDGFEATRQTRQLTNANANIPIIAVTANANPGDRERCIAAGMNDYMKKPFSQTTLVAAINRWLGFRSGSAR
jgi:two-component system, sensor histidine kinase LadS